MGKDQEKRRPLEGKPWKKRETRNVARLLASVPEITQEDYKKKRTSISPDPGPREGKKVRKKN